MINEHSNDNDFKLLIDFDEILLFNQEKRKEHKDQSLFLTNIFKDYYSKNKMIGEE